MIYLRTVFKIFSIIFLIGIFLVSCSAAIIFTRRKQALRLCTVITSRLAGIALRIFGVRVQSSGALPGQNILLVCNHLSYLDVLIISSMLPALFISSVEVKRMFFLGTMSLMGGSIFVERRKKSFLTMEIERISRVLRKGFSVVLFPEGTSSNGDGVLPFRKTFMRSAIQAGVDVVPACIRYTAINGKQVTANNRDRIYYYGDIVFFPHFFNLFRLSSIDVSLKFFAPIRITPGITSDWISRSAYQTICAAYSSFCGVGA
jgi:1-acyl-sn-glycerol-3-phosphate acyltransferase